MIVVFELGFQTVVWLSGTLYVAMLVHIACDITAGLQSGRFGRELACIGPGMATPPGGE